LWGEPAKEELKRASSADVDLESVLILRINAVGLLVESGDEAGTGDIKDGEAAALM
jgi:hypothetical protein